MTLTDEKRQTLERALLNAYFRRDALERMVSFHLGESLDRIAGLGTLPEVVARLVEWACAKGQVARLIAGAQQDRPLNQLVRDLSSLVGPPGDGAQSVEQPPPRESVSRVPVPRPLSQADRDLIADILAQRAATAPIAPQEIFKDLLLRADLPERWRRETAGVWKGDANVDADNLVNWAIGKGVNQKNRSMTTLGSILTVLLRDVGFEEACALVALIDARGLYRDASLVHALASQYLIPGPAEPSRAGAATGPDIEWIGPTDEVELQAWLQPEPDFLDVGLLRSAIERSASVCLVALPSTGRTGTGVLVGPRHVLTNFHVLGAAGEDLERNARELTLRFGYYRARDGDPGRGRRFRLDREQPILKWSPVQALDYVLLQVEDAIQHADDIQPTPYERTPPAVQTALFILQHPAGEAMKVALSADGVTAVQSERGLIQYVTRTAGGSSGAPCFNEDWNLVALHHAERSRSFGRIREGILFGSISRDLGELLPGYG